MFMHTQKNIYSLSGKENSSYPISGCRKHLVQMIADLINFCYSHHMWAEGNQIVSVLLKNKLEFDLKDHLDSIPNDTVLLALDICLHSVEPLKALSLLEGKLSVIFLHD